MQATSTLWALTADHWPAHSAVEDITRSWLLDLLGLARRLRGRLRHGGHDVELHVPGGCSRSVRSQWNWDAARVAADDQGRIDAAALASALASGPAGPTIVVLQAGNVHSGAFDPFGLFAGVDHGRAQDAERALRLRHRHRRRPCGLAALRSVVSQRSVVS